MIKACKKHVWSFLTRTTAVKAMPPLISGSLTRGTNYHFFCSSTVCCKFLSILFLQILQQTKPFWVNKIIFIRRENRRICHFMCRFKPNLLDFHKFFNFPTRSALLKSLPSSCEKLNFRYYLTLIYQKYIYMFWNYSELRNENVASERTGKRQEVSSGLFFFIS